MENDNKITTDASKEWALIEKIATASLIEQKKARRWSTGFKILTFIYLAFVLFAFWPSNSGLLNFDGSGDDHVALVSVKGVIADDQAASANAITTGLRNAFENEHSQAVILAINSPGGSPVQSGYVYNEINRLRKLHPEKPIYAVISDIGASGAYYIAAATDKIYANQASLVGSIGVISASFGFTEAMEKVGVERRNFTSGENKAFLDPFSPLKEDEQAFWSNVLNITHQQFIRAVKAGRGDRLKNNEKLFSGLIWSGEQAMEMGLIDGFASTGELTREIIGDDKIVDYTTKLDPVSQLIRKFSTQFTNIIFERSLAEKLSY